MSTNIDFTRQLIKGRIAENIFCQMYRSAGHFTVLEFGYENIVPELVQHGYREDVEGGIIDTLKTAPDFAVIDSGADSEKVRLVEVKYRKTLDMAETLKIAQHMQKSWNPSYLFIATLDNFYFGAIDEIIASDGWIKPLDDPRLPERLTKQYLQILRDFEVDK
jgi:hypothetical protein